MAFFRPQNISPNAPESEKKVFESLKKLGNDYTVIHSFLFLDNSKKWVQEGEADFIILHPQNGILVIEVKGGNIRVQDNQFQQHQQGNWKTINPVEQARKCEHYIVNNIKKRHFPNEEFNVGHAIWFTDIDYNTHQQLPDGVNREIVGFMNSIENSSDFINQSYNFWNNDPQNIENKTYKKLIDRIIRTYHIVPTLKHDLDTQEQHFVKLTEEQVKILDFLEEQEKAVIAGLAGTGKTLIARQKAVDLAQEGKKILFLCVTRMLADVLEKITQHENIKIATKASFQGTIINNRNLNFHQLEDAFIHYILENNLGYDAIIIDEGQDFSAILLEAFEWQAPIYYIFYDKHQTVLNIENEKYFSKADCKLTLYRNCRNTKQITETALKISQIDSRKFSKILNAVDGIPIQLKPIFDFVTDINYIKSTIDTKKQDGACNADFAIITLLANDQNEENQFNRISHAGLPLSRDISDVNNILFENATRFKGLERKIVFITNVYPTNFYNEANINRLFTAITRGQSEVHILGLQFNEDCYAEIMKNITDNPNGHSKVGFENHFKINIL